MRALKMTIFVLTLFISAAWSTNIYPDWFIFPKNYPQLITGYTYNGMSAVFDAENMYCAYNASIVVGTLEIFNEASSNNLLKNSDYYYYFEPDSVEKIHGRLKLVSNFTTSIFTGDQISAFSLDNPDSSDFKWLNVKRLNRPFWVDSSFMEDSFYYYGVGMYTAIGNENDGWKTAEEQGIFSIINSTAIEFNKIEISYKTGNSVDAKNLDQVTVLKVKCRLRHIKILERYPDRQNKLYYVLVRIPRKDLLSKLIR